MNPKPLVLGMDTYNKIQDMLEEANGRSCAHFVNSLFENCVRTGSLSPERAKELHDPREDL